MKTQPHPAENNRILVIDDNPAIHGDFRKILCAGSVVSSVLDAVLEDVFGQNSTNGAPAEFRVDSAYQGEEALAMVERSLHESRPYALAFVDMRMPPGWGGVETIARIWACDPAIQVVICTAYSDCSWHEIVSKLGNSDRLVILKKPFDSIEVLQLAHAMTRKWLLALQAGQKLEELDHLVKARTRELEESHQKLVEEMAELQLAREALKMSEERLSQAFEACPFPIAIVRQRDHSSVHVNRAFAEATGRDRSEMVGCPPWSAGLGIDNKKLLQLMGQLADGRSVLRQECKLVARDGVERSALLWIEPFALATGPHLLVIVHDVSEQAKLESQLRHAQKVEAIGHLAAGVAHDMNNMLTVVLGYSSILLSAPDMASEIKAPIQEMQNASQRAAALTRQLLAFSRKQVMQKRVLSLSATINDVQAMIRRLIPENIILIVEHPPELPAVFADVCNIEQVLVNLSVNAKDAMPKGGVLTFRTDTVEITKAGLAAHPDGRPGRFVRLTVADTGEGMSEETLSRIFEPFFTTKAVGKGTGMGLATVFGIVHQHDGWIQARSSPGKGTTFEVYFPVSERMQDFGPQIVDKRARRTGRETILLVEDDDRVRALARSVLRASGYSVLEAPDGPVAIATWREYDGQIDLLITDMVMPGGMSGKDVAERFSSDRPDAKVIFSSGYSVDLFGEDLALREGHNYLPKPYLAEQLTEVVARACGNAGLAAA